MSPADTVIMVGAIVAAITAICIFALKVWRVLKRIDSVLGVDQQGRTISDRLERVEYQLFPNNGGSLSDKITRIEKEQSAMQARFDSLQAMVMGIVGGKDGGTKRAS